MLRKLLKIPRYLFYYSYYTFIGHIRSLIRILNWIFIRTVVHNLIIIFAKISRQKGNREFDIGLGPEPMINNIYHKLALQNAGYSAETFVNQVYFITTEFDYRADLIFEKKSRFLQRYKNYHLLIRSFFKYRCVYLYFTGGPFDVGFPLKKYEPIYYKLAGIKVVMLPYGGDVNIMDYCPNLNFKHALDNDYPSFHLRRNINEKQVRLWTTNADHVVSGCDWVDYMYHWDTLTLAHFSIDLKRFNKYKDKIDLSTREFTKSKPLKILHAPNHKMTKGSSFFMEAVDELKKEGFPIELILMEGKSNDEVLEVMSQVDIVADQLIIGWYAMFSLESMAMGKPVICYLREDLIELYLFSGNLASKEEIPHINCKFNEVKEAIIDILNYETDLQSLGEKGLKFVEKYHSIEAIGKIFGEINSSMGIFTNKKYS